jgi:3-oxoacyl-[acyl-carrier-protein] synthase II
MNQVDKYFEVEGLDDCAVIIGVGMSSMQTALHSYIAHLAGDENNKTVSTPHRYNRMVIPMLMPNSVSAWVTIMFGIKGFSYTINASCASGSYAIGEAYSRICEGRCDAAITGGVEALEEENGSIMRGFDMLTALTRSENGVPKPFSHQRSGFLFNEGAGCILILEELERARNRGANIYAEITGFESNSDGYNIAQMEPSGKSIVSMLENLSIGKKIDYINAHGTGTVPNDEIEARALKHVFGGKKDQPVINSTKGILGHSIGASGALEAAVTALSIKEAKIHGNLTKDPIDDLNLNMETIDKGIDYAISMSYGFGGHNAALLFKRYEENG